MSKLDPIDIFSSAVSGYLGRILVLFSAGWAGLLCGMLTALDITRPDKVFLGLWEIFVEKWYFIIFWPITQVLFAFDHPWITFFTVCLTIWMFFAVVHQEEPASLWWIGMAMAMVLHPLFQVTNLSSLVPWTVAGIIWIGFLSIGYFVLRRDYPDLMKRLAQGQFRKSDDDYESIAEIKERIGDDDETKDEQPDHS